ncbi:chordopoxvirus fusion protein [Desulfosoma sp.]
MPFSVQLYQAIDELDPKTKKVFLALLGEVDGHLNRVVTREDFRDLKRIVESLAVSTKELAAAQQRTEARVGELAEAQKRTETQIQALVEAQKRTETRLEQLAEAQQQTEARLVELAEAQKRTEARLEQLAEAQRRLEERVEQLAEAQRRLEERVEQLAEAQRRTEERVEQLAEAQKRTEARLEQLAEAQRRLGERVDQLTEAQSRTEARIEALAEAQKKTETELKKLVQEHRKTREQLGGLAHTVGYRLEDEAFKVLPALLKQDMGVEVQGKLKRDFLEIGPDRYLEVNIWGSGIRDTAQYVILGEAKTQLKKKDVDDFLEKARQVANLVPKDQIRLLVTYQASPPVQKYARDKGVALYFSYDF